MTLIQLYDTTLRDGTQAEGVSFSVEDKVKIARKLDELGIHFIEGGWPGSNPKDAEFFRRARSLKLQNARLAAFGATRRAGLRAEDDPNLQALVAARTPVVCIVGKAWDRQAVQVLQVTPDENLSMISETVAFLKGQRLTVFYDAEHFFDGFKGNPGYALRCLAAAAQAGADCLVLCDTNGGALPTEVVAAFETVKKSLATPLGIHTHNDGELAVANTLAAVRAGATHVQGTINGYGERCGNANLCSVIPNLQLKLGIPCLKPEQLARLTEVSHFVSELANLPPNTHLPYVGTSAFAHKGGIHASAVARWEDAYQHIKPEVVGNHPKVLVSELSGKSNIAAVARELGLEVDLEGTEAQAILERIKERESRGFWYEGAEASFEVLVRRARGGYQPPFELVDFMVVVEKHRRPSTQNGEELLAEATVKVRVKGEVIHTAAEGNGPVNALDAALRKALVPIYPDLAQVKLTDYKVRILDEAGGTGSQVRVLMESSDGKREWRTVGSSTNLIEASWLALTDSLEYWFLHRA